MASVMRAEEQSTMEWGWAGRGLEASSGDLHVLARFAGGALVALVDGLGHGPEAAAAAEAAASVLEAHAGDPVLSLVQRCHEELRRTRGVVMSVASFDMRVPSMTWAGVGNVDGVLLRRRRTAECTDEAISVRAGVVGYQLPALRAQTIKVWSGDTLIMVTDGVRSAFSAGLSMDDYGPQEIAESILARFAKGSDDAHVVVARYVEKTA